MENQLQNIRGERDQYMKKLIDTEHELKKQSVGRSLFDREVNQICIFIGLSTTIRRTIKCSKKSNERSIERIKMIMCSFLLFRIMK